MATEHVEEVKLTKDIKDAEKETSPESKDLEVGDEEKIIAENSQCSVRESATQSEGAIALEEKQDEHNKSKSLIDEVQKEEEISDPSVGDTLENEEISKDEAKSSTGESKEESDSSKKAEKNQDDVTNVPESPKESIATSVEDSKATIVQESESETTKEFADPQGAIERVNATTEELLEGSFEPELQGKEEPQIVSPINEPTIEEENTEAPKDATSVTDSIKTEVLGAVIHETKEVKDDAGGTIVTKEVSKVSEMAESDQNVVASVEECVSIDTDPTIKSIGDILKPEEKLEGEVQEKAVVAEEPIMRNATKNDDAVTEASAGGSGDDSVIQEKVVVAEEPTLSHTAKIDADTQVTEVSSDCSGGVEKTEENKEVSLEYTIIQEKAVEAEETTMSDTIKTEATEASFKGFDGAEKIEEKKSSTLEGLFMQERAVVTEEQTISDTAEAAATTQVTEIPSEVSGGVEKFEEKMEPSLEGLLTQEKAVVAEEPTLPDTIETDATTQVTEVASDASGGVEKVEEKKEASLESSVVESSKDLNVAAEGIDEKKDVSLESENMTLVETSRDIDVEPDKLVNEQTEKDDAKTTVEPTKEGSEARKVEVTAKSSHRHSDNIFSKVKQSIVKVRKAIMGKSPSSKAMSAEGKDEIKVK